MRVRTCAPPITTWTANRTAAPTASRTSVRRSRCVRQAATATASTIKPDDGGDPAVQDVGAGQVGQRRDQRAAHQRPVREDQGRVGGGHLRAEQQEGEGGRGGEGGEQREALARAAPRQVGRVAGPHGQEDQQPDQGHRAGQVRGDRFAAVAEPDRLAPEPCLEADQHDRAEGRPEDRRPRPMVAQGEHRQAQDLEPDDRRDRPVDPFDPGLEVTGRRQDLAVAERPVRTAETRIGGPHDHADRDQPEGGRETERGELLEAVHEAPF